MPTAQELNITDKLDSILTTKQAIREAIVEKGVEVPEGTTFREYAQKIENISTKVTPEVVKIIFYTMFAGFKCFYINSSYETIYQDIPMGEYITVDVIKNSVVGAMSSRVPISISVSGDYENLMTNCYLVKGNCTFSQMDR